MEVMWLKSLLRDLSIYVDGYGIKENTLYIIVVVVVVVVVIMITGSDIRRFSDL